MVKLTASRFESDRLASLKDVRYVLGALHRDHSLSGLFIFARKEIVNEKLLVCITIK